MKRRILALFGTLALLLPLLPTAWLSYAANEKPGFYGTSLFLENNIAVNFVVDIEDFEAKGFSDPQVTFTFEGNSSTASPVIRNGCYYFTFRDLTPTRMGEAVTATLSAEKNGARVYGDPVEESVLSYCLRTLDDSAARESALSGLIVDLLTYGAKSQLYFDVDAEHPVTDSLTAEQKSLGTQTSPAPVSRREIDGSLGAAAAVIWEGAGLKLEDAVKLQFVFATKGVDVSQLFFEIDKENGDLFASFSGKDAESYDGVYRLCCDALSPDRMTERLTIVAYNEDGDPVSDTLYYSVESYAAEAIGTYKDTSLTALLYAMLNYGASARAYAEEAPYEIRVPEPAAAPNYTFDHTPTETEIRAMAVKAMRDELSVQWYTPEEIRFNKDGAAAGEYVYDANRFYGGLPYTSAGIGLFQFLDYYDSKTGKLLYTDSETFNDTIGNTCGSSAVWALFSVCTSLRGLCTSKNLTKANGFIPLGDLDYEDSVTEFNKTYSTKNILQSYSVQTVYQAYTRVKPGDLLVFSDGGEAAGHTMMAIADAVVIYDSYGNIDPQSYIKIQDQRPDLLEDPAGTGIDISYFGRRSTKFFFSYLRSSGYLPVTTAEFLGTKAYENAALSAKNVNTDVVPSGNVSTKYISSYYLESNYPMALAQFVVNAGTEKEQVIQTKYFSRTQVNSGTAFHWQMTDFANPVRNALQDAGYVKDGSVLVTIRVTVSNGAVFEPVTFIYN